MTLALSVISVSAAASEAVCAEVRIEIRQKLSLERQAFDAVLRLRNGLTSSPIENVEVNVLFTDELGNPVEASSDPNQTSASFFVRLDGLEDLGAVDGTGVVQPTRTGVARWLIVPDASSGGSTPQGRIYRVGARISYTVNGDARSVEVTPEAITVRPQPRLALDYFIAGDVYADDPFTPQLEPSEPFTFGVRVRNVGAGAGRNVRIESAQPRIVENEQGLLIGFSLLGGFVDDQPAAASLALSLGDIAAGHARMGRWLMETTLSGRFEEIEATYSHADTLGGSLTSLIEGQPASHLLIHDVLVDLPGRDGVRDFLARDGDVLRVYESSGVDSEVLDASAASTLTAVGASGNFSLTVPGPVGLVYARVADPSSGTLSGLQGARADGSALPAANVWFSKRRNQNLSWSYFINVFDSRGGGTFSLRGDLPLPTASIEGRVFFDANANGTQDPDETGLADAGLILEGETQAGTVQRAASSSPTGGFGFSSLPAGRYRIAVGNVPGYINGAHSAGSAGGMPQLASIEGIELGVAVAASGYRFSKVLPTLETAADLRVEPIGVGASAEISQPFDIALRVRNLGPQGSIARAVLTLPEQFQVSAASVSSGEFDAASGRWSVGSLPAGAQESILVRGSFSAPGRFDISLGVQPEPGAPPDPVPTNNSITLPVEVTEPAALAATLTPSATTRLLVWSDCDAGQPPQCAESRRARWSALLQAETELLVAGGPQAFRDGLRSLDWNVIAIDGTASRLDAGTLLSELREFLRRGGAVVFSGQRDDSWARFESIAGAQSAQSLPDGPDSLLLEASEYSEPAQLEMAGAKTSYSAAGGRILGRLSGGQAVLVAGPLEPSRKVLIAGFDLLQLLERADAAGFKQRLLNGLGGAWPGVILGQTRLDVALRVTQPTPAGELIATLDLPPGAELIAASPAPQSSQAGRLQWLRTLPPDVLPFQASIALRAPAPAGPAALLAAAQLNAQLAEQSRTFAVRDLTGLAAEAEALLAAIPAAPGAQAAAVARSRQLLDEAVAALQASEANAGVQKLTLSIQELGVVPMNEARAAELGLSWVLAAMARRAGPEGNAIFADSFEFRP